MRTYDAVVIGAGFFGCRIALALKQRGAERVCLIEREAAIMRRASFVNQARVHNGYHYPRSLSTAVSSRKNFSRFVQEHSYAVETHTEMIYAIASQSRVTPQQFERFCAEIGAPCREDGQALTDLFDPALIENCFRVREIAFNAAAIAQDLDDRLTKAGVERRFRTEAAIRGWDDRRVYVQLSDEVVAARQLYNCTYANLDGIGVTISNIIKKELAEVALIEPPVEMRGRAVTVMDGPYFSSMPFPALDCYSLTHVRYTPHSAWTDPGDQGLDFCGSRASAMIRDAMRYMPLMESSKYLRSLYEIKAVLVGSESSDARPIVFETAPDCPRIQSVLGSKIDNIYDILEALDRQELVS